MSAVSNDSSLLNMDEVSLGSSVDEISTRSLLDAQKQDQVIGRLVTFLRNTSANNTVPPPREREGKKVYQNFVAYGKNSPRKPETQVEGLT